MKDKNTGRGTQTTSYETANDLMREANLPNLNVYDYDEFMKFMKDSRSSLKKERNDWFIYGSSGFGKSYLSAQMRGRFQVHVINCDKFGVRKDIDGRNRWIIDWRALKPSLLENGWNLLEGTGDNFSDYNNVIQRQIDVVVIPVPDLATFKRIIRAKAIGRLLGEQPENNWVRDYRVKSRYTPSEFRRFILSKLELAVKYFDPVRIILVAMPPSDTIASGWHGETHQVRAERKGLSTDNYKSRLAKIEAFLDSEEKVFVPK